MTTDNLIVNQSGLYTSDYTQEADSLKCSKPMTKVVVGGPRVLKVFSGVLIYKVSKKNGLGPKKSVKPD